MRPQRLARKSAANRPSTSAPIARRSGSMRTKARSSRPARRLQLFEAIRTSQPATRRALPATLPCPRCTLPLDADARPAAHDAVLLLPVHEPRALHAVRPVPPRKGFHPRTDTRRAGPAQGRRFVRSAARHAARRSTSNATRPAPTVGRRSPILDPDAVAATVRALQSAEARRTTIDVGALVDAMLDAQREARGSTSWSVLSHQGSSATVDLVRLGLDAIAAFMTR